MAARFLSRRVATHVSSSQLIPAAGCSFSLHTVVACLDTPASASDSRHPAAVSKPTAKSDTPRNLETDPARSFDEQEAARNQTQASLPSNGPARGRAPPGSEGNRDFGRQRQFAGDRGPPFAPQRNYQPRGQFGDTQREFPQRDSQPRGQFNENRRDFDRPSNNSQRNWRAPSDRPDSQHQRPNPALRRQGGGAFRASPTRPDSEPSTRPVFIDRSNTNSGPRPAFVARSSPNQAPRPAFVDRSQLVNRDSSPNRRQQPAWQARRAPPPQQGRPVPSSAPMDEEDPDDPQSMARPARGKRYRSQMEARGRASPSSARTERSAPGADLRGGGPAKGPRDISPAVAFDADMAFQDSEQMDEGASENFLERMQHNPQGVPASWKDEIQDIEVTQPASR